MNSVLISTRTGGLLAGFFMSASAMGAGEISSVILIEQPATPSVYEVDGIEYRWGRGNNQFMDGFVTQGKTFEFIDFANEVSVRRDDIGSVASGEPCGVFVERLSLDASSRTFAADYPTHRLNSENCDLELLLESRIVNRGVVDVFSNTRPDAKNIERLDYLFLLGALAPLTFDELDSAGHVVAEKSGNNPLKMAAILSLDVFGQPEEYGPLLTIAPVGCSEPEVCYGITDLMHDYSFLQNEFNAPQSFPVETERSQETVGMAFVSAADLGLLIPGRYLRRFYNRW